MEKIVAGCIGMNVRQYNRCYLVLAQKTFDSLSLCLIEVLYEWSIDSNDNRNSQRIEITMP